MASICASRRSILRSSAALVGCRINSVRWQQHIYYRMVFCGVRPSLCAVKQCEFTGSIKLLRKVVFRCRSPFRRTHCAIETNHCAVRPVWAQVIRFFAVTTVHRSNLSINPDGYAAGYFGPLGASRWPNNSQSMISRSLVL
jgi:hypothetical protein